MRRFYDPHITVSATTHTLSEEESKHIVRVLRMQVGDQLEMVDGKGTLFTCAISSAHPKKCELKVLSVQTSVPETYQIHIVVGPTKQTDRLEWFMEKATEIGITELSFLTTKNAERAQLKLDRLEKKAIAALKQSKRLFLPKINPLTTFENFVKAHPNGLIAHCMEGNMNVFESVFSPQNCPILIGPEGDFTPEEVSFALENGYKTITLGKNRLRTETAALYVCMRAKLMTDHV